VECDAGKEEDQKRAFELAEKQFGHVHFVIANAGFEGSGVPSLLNDDDAVANCEKVLKINILGTIISLKYGTLALRKAGGGAIIAISSGVGSMSPMGSPFVVPSEVSWAYGPSKAAIDQMVRNSAGLANEKIRVYSVGPQVYRTDMAERGTASMGITVDLFAHLLNPVSHTPGDPADLVKIFLSIMDETTAYLPGDLICCDGDATFLGDVRLENIYRHQSGQHFLDMSRVRDAQGNPGYVFSK